MEWPILRANAQNRRRLKEGNWVRLHRGIYVPGHLASSAGMRGAAALHAVPGSVLSHDTAAAIWRIGLVNRSPVEHVTVPRASRRPSWRTLHVHAMQLEPDDIAVWRGLRLTVPLRTLHDLARNHDRLTVVWAVEQTMTKRLVAEPALVAAARSLRARQWWPLADRRSESPLETGVRLVLLDAGLPPPQLQIPFRNGLFRIDLGYREAKVGIEADGRSTHDLPDAIYSDRQRANALNEAGWRLLRFTWRDLMARPDYIVASVRAALNSRAA